MAQTRQKLLAGITVLDFTRVLAGPYCTRLLADQGADVIKVERPIEGDEVRHIVLQLDPGRTDQSSYFIRLNAGKRSIAVDLAHPDARAVILDLVRRADVLVENFSPGVMAKYGLDHASLAPLRPDLVYCSISGFGQTGPLAGMQAYAHLINAISGMMDLERAGGPEPRAAYLQAADVLAGTHAFGAICAALVRHGRTGEGAWLDVSMLECLVGADDINYAALLNGGAVERRARVGMVVHEIGGRHIAMQTAGAAHLWGRIVALAGRPELATDPRFATAPARRDNWTELLPVLREWLDDYASVDDAVRALSGARIPTVPMLSPEEVVDHPQMTMRQAFPEIPHAARGTVRVTASPFHVDGQPVHPAGAAPREVGEHTREILARVAGYEHARIDDLEARGVVSTH